MDSKQITLRLNSAKHAVFLCDEGVLHGDLSAEDFAKLLLLVMSMSLFSGRQHPLRHVRQVLRAFCCLPNKCLSEEGSLVTHKPKQLADIESY
jgi:hypothetical protein